MKCVSIWELTSTVGIVSLVDASTGTRKTHIQICFYFRNFSDVG